MGELNGRSGSRLRSTALVLTLVLASTAVTLPHRALGQDAPSDILVTNDSDVSNGDTSTVANLKADAGPDGISLREAIEATNNDPGSYNITFDNALNGSTILLGDDLPALLGGEVTIDGDIDDDPQPDVTLRSDNAQAGFKISSSNNQLRSIKLARFQFGVIFQPPPAPVPTGVTFAGNTVSGLTLRGIQDQGIVLDPTALGDCGVPCGSGNTWSETAITNNSIVSRSAGIFLWNASTDETIERATITDNEVRITGRATGSGISLETAGPLGGDASTGARISDVLIAGNSVQGSPDIGINVAAGTGRAQAGIVHGIRVLNNHVELTKSGTYYCCFGIAVQAGSDSASFAKGPPIRYLDDNVVRDVVVRGNKVTGTLEMGIGIQAGIGGGGRRNRVKNVKVIDNLFETSKPTIGAYLWTGDGEPYRNRYSAGNRITDVVLKANRFKIGTGRKWALAGGGAGAGGVVLLGGHRYGRENLIRNVRITRSSIRTAYVGMRLIGGIGSTAKRNRVVCIDLTGNRIRGARKKVLVRSNVDGAIGNRASLAC